MKNILVRLFCLSIFILLASSLYAQSDQDIVAYKQNLMKSNGLHMGMIGQILQKKVPFTDQITSQAKVIELNMALFKEASEKKILGSGTESKAEIWDNWAAFSTAADKAIAAAEALADAKEGDVMSKTRDLGGTCGACHQMFRVPKN